MIAKRATGGIVAGEEEHLHLTCGKGFEICIHAAGWLSVPAIPLGMFPGQDPSPCSTYRPSLFLSRRHIGKLRIDAQAHGLNGDP